MGSVYADSIGDIVESTGVGKIVRQQENISNLNNLPIQLNDVAETAMGSMLIKFLDNAELLSLIHI